MKYFFLIFIILDLNSLFSQNCDVIRYKMIWKEADKAIVNGQYELAINKLQSAKVCQPDSGNVVDRKIIEVFKIVNKLRQKANENEKIAQQQLEKANRLIYHLNFQNERATWVFKNGKFAVINLNGDTLSSFLYEFPEPFKFGKAIASRGNQYVVINSEGIESNIKYDYVIKCENQFYWAGREQSEDLLDSTKNIIFSFPKQWFYSDVFHKKSCSEGNRLNLIRSENKKLGFINDQGEIILNPKYDRILCFSEGLAAIKINKKWGFIDTTGNEVVPPIYDYVENFSQGAAVVRKNNKYGFVDKKGRLYINAIYDSAEPFSEGFAVVKINKKYFFIDLMGMPLNDQKHDYASPFSEGLAYVENNKKWGFINKMGEVIIPLIYDRAGAFSSGYAEVSIGKKKFKINKSGQTTEVPSFESHGGYSEGLWGVKYKGHWGFIDVSGKTIIDFVFDEPGVFKDNLAIVKKGDTLIIITKTGRKVLNTNYERGYYIKNGLFHVEKGRKYGIIDTTGKVIVPVKYEGVDLMENGKFAVKKGDNWLIADQNGNELILQNFSFVGPYSPEGQAEAGMEGKWGKIDKLGNIINPITLDSSGPYSKSACTFCGMWGDEEELDSIMQVHVEEYTNGLKRVGVNSKFGIIDTANAMILAPEYSEIFPCGYRIFITKQNARYGIFAPDFGIQIEPAYEQFGNLGEENDWIRVQQNGKWGWIDKQGKIKIPIQFDVVTPFKNGKSLVKKLPYYDYFYINTKGEMILNSNLRN